VVHDPLSSLAALRTFLKEYKLGGFFLPRENRFQSSHLPPGEERLAWLTGFSGSAGSAVVLPHRAALCVDSRYILAASRQVPPCFDVTEEAPETWLRKAQPEGENLIGFDPWQVTLMRLRRLQKALPNDIFHPVQKNPVDLLWLNRPSCALPSIFSLEEKFSGVSSEGKVKQVLQQTKNTGASAVLITDSASIAWLLNVRADIPFLPAPPAYALVQEGAPILLFSAISTWPESTVYRVFSLEEMPKILRKASISVLQGDPQEMPCAIETLLVEAGKELREAPNPCQVLKAIKNPVERQGFRDCHERDGLALIEFFSWLERATAETPVDERMAAEKLYHFRARSPLFRGPSFETISAAGAQAAFIHYQTPHEGGVFLRSSALYLCDSGAQYQDGTTDCTRTVAIASGQDSYAKRVYTAVLQGLIAATTTIFPVGTPGTAIDAIARRPLWIMGLTYAHSTGHGVGHFLDVHENPPLLSKISQTPLSEGMVLSIEPGFYQADAFGVRLENLVEVVPAPDHPGFLTFSTLTLVPFESSFLEVPLLKEEELSWLKAYHTRIWKTLHSRLSPEAQGWLKTRL
jgi:Xaa-Pro aminopeptidase